MENQAEAGVSASFVSRKVELEVEKLTLEVANARRTQRFDLVLRLLPSLTIMVTVLGFGFSVWQYYREQAKGRQAAERQAIREAEASQREFMKPLLENYCVPCHKAGNQSANIRFDSLPAAHSAAGRAWLCIEGRCPSVEPKSMPPVVERWSAEEKSQLYSWFKDGAPSE